MSTLSQFMGGGIKSVQRGVFAGSTTENTINISPVNPAKAFVNVTSERVSGGEVYWWLRLASSTTLAAVSASKGASGTATPLYWEVIEFY